MRRPISRTRTCLAAVLFSVLGLRAGATTPVMSLPSKAPEIAPNSEESSELHWDGWKIMVADAASVGAFLGGSALVAANHQDGFGRSLGWFFFYSGVAGYALAPAVVHALDENDSTGWKLASTFGSVALRVGLPVLAFSYGCAHSGGGEDACWDGGATAALVGIGAAMVLDWTALSWVRPPSKPEAIPMWIAPATVAGRPGLALGGRW